MYHRLLKLPKNHSFFLFGARGTGKTELLRANFGPEEAISIDLLNPELSNELSAYPNRLENILAAENGKKKWVIIDEIQKVPSLLDIVHKQISLKNFHFALTGSSARKLKRGAANLLAGRAYMFELFPLSIEELGKDFNLDEFLQFGSLPEVINSKQLIDKKRFLKAYAETYLKEEIIAEQLIRNLPPFRRFLDIVGSQNGEIVNYTNIARDIDSDSKTINRYFDILEDTLLGFYLPSYHTSLRKQQKKSKKFYFFDTGIVRVLNNEIDDNFRSGGSYYGKLFESFIINEIKMILTYKEKQFKLSFIRISDEQEVDLVVEIGSREIFLYEIKSSQKAHEGHAKNLNAFSQDFKNKKVNLRVISRDTQKKQFGDALALPYQDALDELSSL